MSQYVIFSGRFIHQGVVMSRDKSPFVCHITYRDSYLPPLSGFRGTCFPIQIRSRDFPHNLDELTLVLLDLYNIYAVSSYSSTPPPPLCALDPGRNPDHPQTVIDCSLAQGTNLETVSCKSLHYFGGTTAGGKTDKPARPKT